MAEILEEYIKLLDEPWSFDEQTNTIKIGRRFASGRSREDAYLRFIEQYNIKEALRERKRQLTAEDYIKYGKKHILPGLKIHINKKSFFEKNYELLAVDSEGHNKENYPEIIQFAVSDTEVYIFNVKQHLQGILNILQNKETLKIVYDLGAEERAFKVKYANVLDLQKPREGFVKAIFDVFGVSLKKNKRVHIMGWDANKLSNDQLYYSAFDVVWMFKLYFKLF